MVFFKIEGIFPEWPTQEQGFCTVHVLSIFMEHTDCFLLFTFLQQGANEKPNDIPGCGVLVFVSSIFEGQPSEKEGLNSIKTRVIKGFRVWDAPPPSNFRHRDSDMFRRESV